MTKIKLIFHNYYYLHSTVYMYIKFYVHLSIVIFQDSIIIQQRVAMCVYASLGVIIAFKINSTIIYTLLYSLMYIVHCV